jgi:hypothetical protein
MDIDMHGIFLVNSSDYPQENYKIFMDFEKCRDYSYDKKILKVSMKKSEDSQEVNVTISLSDESIQELLKGVMKHHSIVILLF